MEKVIAALKTLGIKGKVRIEKAEFNQFKVLLNNEYFGIFDVTRNTFVD